MAGRLDGRVALISGGARGQGAAHARLLAQEGAAVVIGDVLDADGERTAQLLGSEQLQVTYRHLDVTSSADWSAAVEATEAAHGKLDILVNNAGIVRYAGAADCSDEEWNTVIGVNQTGMFMGIRAAVPALRRAGGGSIVNISSIFGLGGAADYVAYAASKAAVLGMTKSVALSYATEKIRANAICPGAVDTAQLREEVELFFDGKQEPILDLIPMRQIAQPGDISEGVLFLASDESRYITGSTMIIDGGWTIA